MKILVISHMYPSAVNPVYGIFVHKYVQALIKLGHEIHVISPVPYAPWPLSILRKKWRGYAAVPSQDRIDGVDVHYPRYPEFPRSFLFEHSGRLMALGIQRRIRNIRQNFEFDVIHAHVALPDGSAAIALKEKYKVPVVVTIHGQDFQSTINIRKSCRQKVFEILEKADRIITVSSKLKKLVQDQPFANKIDVIPNGINLEELVHNDKDITARDIAGKENFCDPYCDSSSDSVKKIISVSNLKKTKGIDLNIRAIARIIVDFPNVVYYIVGDGEERQNLENLTASLKLQEHVVFLGKLSHAEAMRQIAAADIFCLPSWQEGFGAVYIEAMSQGIPTIGVQGEGIEDAIIHGKNGLLVRPHDGDDIVGALTTLLTKPDYAKTLADEGRRTVADNFTWEKSAMKTITLYEQLLTKANQETNRRTVH